jgi:hypothetical protein
MAFELILDPCKALVTIPSIHDKLKDFGCELVGSRAWGGSQTNSDYDYMVNKKAASGIADMLRSENISIQENSGSVENGSCYICVDGKVFNLIYLNDKVLLAWQKASKMMMSFPQNDICNRQLRRFVFTLLVDTFLHVGG